MEGVKDRLGDLSWLGINDKAWFEANQKDIVDYEISKILEEVDQILANQKITKGQLINWTEYKRLINEIYLQPDYPNIVSWPPRPE